MIPQNFEYTAPKTLDEALGLLAGGAKPLSGGMSLIPMMKLRLAAPEHLVDLGTLKDLNYIREAGWRDSHRRDHDAFSTSRPRRWCAAKCPLLAETAAHIGDVQVRNMGTIGGSVAHADPSADYPAALQALEAKFVLKGAKSERTVSAADFFVDTFTTAIEPGEIIREVIVPVEDRAWAPVIRRMVQPASGFAIVGVAARVSHARAGRSRWRGSASRGCQTGLIARRRPRRRSKARPVRPARFKMPRRW